jgi:transposase
MLNLGHGRSPLWCGSQNHHRDLRPGYGRLLRYLGAAQAAITFNGASFPTCYGTEFTSKAKRRYKRRNRIEIMFGRLKDWRRVATRYDRCPKVFLSAVALAATVMFWL